MKVFQSHPNRIDESVVEDFKDAESGEEYRYAYADEHLNTWIALQIKAIREKRGLKQSELAELIGTQQPGIARLENVNYSNWKTETLKKVARALGVRLKISFETFGSLLDEDATFDRGSLERPTFKDDPAFKETELREQAVAGIAMPQLGAFRKPTNPFVPLQIEAPDEESRLTQQTNVARLEDKKHGDTGRQNR